MEHIDRLRAGYAHVARTHPFITEAIGVMPDHLHALWTLPSDDADYPRRWSLIKAYLSRTLPADPQRSASKAGRREKGIW